MSNARTATDAAVRTSGDRSSSVTLTEQPEAPTIIGDLTHLNEALDSLQERVNTIAGRLSPILADTASQDVGDKDCGPGNRSGVSCTIHALRERVCEAEEGVRDILSRIELP